MSFKHRNKTLVAALAATVALGTGVGVAAASSGSQNGTSQGAASDQREDNDDVQDPELNGSIQVQEVEGESEQQEAARLADLATVSPAEAEKAALAEVPGGKVVSSEVGDENGSLIWEVEVTKADGSMVEVKVDAGAGTVLAQEADDEDEQDENDE